MLLLGPRQVGKSTLLQHLKPNLVVNLAREKEFLEHSSHPQLLEELIRGAKPKLVLVDEVQRIPGLSALELEGNLNLKKSMAFGFLPEIFLEKDLKQAADILFSYAGTYLKEEVQAELLVRNIQGFSRFLMHFAEHSGKILDLSKVSSKAKVSRTGASRFLEILEETLLVLRCDSFQEAKTADTVSHSKYYFFDPGVLNGLLGGYYSEVNEVVIVTPEGSPRKLKNGIQILPLSRLIFQMFAV